MDGDKTFQDVLSMPAVDPPPAWFHVLGWDFTAKPGEYTKEIDLSLNAAYDGSPFYIVCFLADKDTAVGAAGTIEVQR